LVRRAVEVEPVDVGGFNDVSIWSAQGRQCHQRGCVFYQSRSRCEMRSHLRLGLIWKWPAPKQAAIGDQAVSVRMNHCLDRQRAGLAPVELERRQEVYLFNRLDMPVRKQAQGSLGERLDAHDAGQHWRAVNLMVVQKRLNGRIECGL